MTDIVKIQRPLASTDPAEPCLIYDEQRLRSALVPFDMLPDHVRAALNTSPKVYCLGTWTGGAWTLGFIVGDKSW